MVGQGAGRPAVTVLAGLTAAAYHVALRAILTSLGTLSSPPFLALAHEIQLALEELESDQEICQHCGYPNPPYRSRCKNCDEQIPG